jgi:hypothetical protein
MTDTPDIEAALRQERLEIARILRAEAAKHEAEAEALRDQYADENLGDEADMHDSDAALIDRLADLILARTPTVAVEEAPELVF